MPLTPAQKQASDELVTAFFKFIATFDAAIVPGPAAPGPGVSPPPLSSRWWNPTPDEFSRFCADFGVTEEQLDPAATGEWPILPATTDPTIAKRYAGFGFAATGLQLLKTDVAFARARKKADEVNGAKTPEQMDAVMPGAKSADREAVIYGLMTATGASWGPMGDASFGGKALTIPDLIVLQYTTSDRKPGEPGPSIG